MKQVVGEGVSEAIGARAPGTMETPERLRVLFLQSQAPFTSSGAMHALVLRHFDPDRLEAHAAITSEWGMERPGAYRELAAIPGLTIRPTLFGPTIYHRPKAEIMGELARQGGPTAASLGGLARYIRQRRISIIHAPDKPQDIIYGDALAALTGARLVVHVHGFVGQWMGWRRVAPMRLASSLIGISHYVTQTAVEMGFAPSRVYTVYNALDAARWNPDADPTLLRREFGIPLDAPVMTIVSRVLPTKGHHLLIPALASIRRTHPDARLLVVGDDDPGAAPGRPSYLARMRALAGELGVQENVIFTGPRSDIQNVLAATDIYAMPCIEEGFGLAFVEAMAMRKPVVAARHGATPEIVLEGRSGLLSDPEDIPSLTRNLLTLIERPELRAEMGYHNRRRAETEFTPQRMADGIEAVYRDTLRRAPERPRLWALRRAQSRPAAAAPARAPHAPRTLLAIFVLPDAGRMAEVAAGRQPRRDFDALREASGADMLTLQGAFSGTRGAVGRAVARIAGRGAGLALVVYLRRRRYDVIYSDTEHVGLPLALLLRWLSPGGRPAHVALAHALSPAKKRLFFALGARKGIDALIVHSSAQRALAIERLGMPPERVFRLPYFVDTGFWRPDASPSTPSGASDQDELPLLLAPGLERRDYATLSRAVEGLPVTVRLTATNAHAQRVVMRREGAVTREWQAPATPLASNITLAPVEGATDLRALYAQCRFVLVPLEAVDFTAGVTVILEAMAMGKAVIVTGAIGQSDVIRDPRGDGRGDGVPVAWPGFLKEDPALADNLGQLATGLYTRPGDAVSLRAAITNLLDHPDLADELGRNGRQIAEAYFDINQFAERIQRVFAQAAGGTTKRRV